MKKNQRVNNKDDQKVQKQDYRYFIEHLLLDDEDSFEDEKRARQMCKGMEGYTNLKSLNLIIKYKVSIDSKIMELMGQSISKCNQISSLNLIMAKSGKPRPQGISSLLRKIVSSCNLTDLNISQENYKIENDEAAEQGNLIANCKNLVHLSLRFCRNQLDNNGALSIVQGISNCQYLKSLELDFSYNDIDKFQAEKIGVCIQKLKNLERLYLDLTKNSITNASLKGLFSELTKCKNISNLTLNINSIGFGNSIGQQLGVSMKSWTNLMHLRLEIYENNVSSEGMLKIGESLHSLSLNSLSLDLRNNEFGLKEISSISKGLEACSKNLHKLHLELQGNKIKKQGIDILMKSVSSCATIKNLHLSFQEKEIDHKTFNKIGTEIAKIHNLNELQLIIESVMIPISNITSLLKELNNLQYLFNLHLNIETAFIIQLTSRQLYKQYIEGITSLKNLKTLMLSIPFQDTFRDERLLSQQLERKIISKLSRLTLKEIK